MERNLEKEILDELKSINQSLQKLTEKNNEVKQPSILIDIVKSLLVGICIVGPAIAVLYGLFQILGS
ncbi:hypothetical protein [Pseudalkalibacillus salsuginis]|uniref:hypothetical protein n=1 Tax=Pseudalkalibacillus salsuginis TaxID=2910972 RepID=UPI001F315285|nr:hypothetical protein [Pseudalkalibacillus salsuginis]MCF6409799.1 hypothetical protein [Pseudalkalibacillus salsuginis]